MKIASTKQSASKMGRTQKLVSNRQKFPEYDHKRYLELLKADITD